MKKSLRKFSKIIVSLMLVCLIILLFSGNFVYSFALLRESVFSRENVMSFITHTSDNTAAFSGTNEEEKKTWLEINGTSKYITSLEGLTLHGFYVENPNNNHHYAIVCHGYSSKASHMSYFTKMFYDRGFSVLAPDARAHGDSEGNIRGMGYIEKRDIIYWVNEILKNDSEAQVILYGISMGAATVLFTSGESDLPSCVKAVISDCAYTDVYKEIGNTVKSYAPFMPSFPLVDAASFVCKIRAGFSFKEASCIEAVKRSKTPTLFIHGSADTFVPFYMLDELYNNASCEKEKLIIEGAVHARSATQNPDVYWATVDKFLNGKLA